MNPVLEQQVGKVSEANVENKNGNHASTNSDSLNVLIVDDSAPARQFIEIKIKELMDSTDYQLFTADSGEDALAMFEKCQIDLIFLDVEMPGISGLEVCKRIREKSDRARIVMLTGRSLSADYVSGRDAGCNHYLTKPPADGDVQTILTLSRLKKSMKGGFSVT